MDDVFMGLDHLLQWVLRTYHWFHPTFFHSCLEDACELLKFLLGERDKNVLKCVFVALGFSRNVDIGEPYQKGPPANVQI